MKISKQVFTKDSLNQKGAASLLVATLLSIIFTILCISLAKTNLIKFRSLEILKHSRKSYYLAESGVEDTMIRLREDITYTGKPFGQETPIGKYYSNVTRIGDVIYINAWRDYGKTYREVELSVTMLYELAPIATKATYMSDTFSIKGPNSRIRGDVWTNDDFVVEEYSIIEGNLSAAGKGSQAVNWVWDGVVGGSPTKEGGKVIDNPETEDVIEGNITAFDTVKVSGSGSYVQGNVISNRGVEEIYGGIIGGSSIPNAGLTWEDIPVPNFDFKNYKQEAIAKGTYFSNQNQFSSYLASLDNGIERRFPDNLYYVASGAVKIYKGSPVYLNGLLIVEDNLDIYCEWHQDVARNLPALIAGKDLKILRYGGSPSGPVEITGIVYSGKKIELYREDPSENIFIDGAVWAGDDIFISGNTFIKYNRDIAANVTGFDFVTGVTKISKNYWREVY